MKRLDDGRTSLVDFVRSIRFDPPHTVADAAGEDNPGFARFEQRVRARRSRTGEEAELVRSAN